MAKFIDLTVTAIENTTADAVVVSLRPTDGSVLSFVQGQYLTFKATIDGQEVRRSYSICSPVGQDIVQVGIKRVQGGTFSNWANGGLTVGDTLKALSPMGHFHTPLSPDQSHSYLGFAIGSGITPVLSIIRTTLATEPNSSFSLVYANRSIQSIMFKEELEDLKNRFMNRLSVTHILKSGQEDIELFSGRLDQEKLADLFTKWLHVPNFKTAFICGPEDAMKTIASTLHSFGMAPENIKYELFGTARPRQAAQPISDQASAEVHLKVTLDGASREIAGASGTSLLDAALNAGIEAPYACKAGVCSTCRCKVTVGAAEMRVNHALEDYEVAQGYVLSCQAYPTSDQIHFEYDE
jgi:ring-1,2-phenylacetyl-CoA epoxidase subunit PaaE